MVSKSEMVEKENFTREHGDDHLEAPAMVQSDEGKVKSSANEEEWLRSIKVEVQPQHERLGLIRSDMQSDVAASLPSVERPLEGSSPLEQRLSLLTRRVLNMIHAKAKAFRQEVCVSSPKPATRDAVSNVGSEDNPQVGEFSNRKRQKCAIAGETLTSFELPDEFVEDAFNIDQFPLSEDQRKIRQFSLHQRLNHWKIQRRQRTKGTYDLYYYHMMSGRLFRSAPEVTDFILFEAYPSPQVSGSAKRGRQMNEENVTAVEEQKHCHIHMQDEGTSSKQHCRASGGSCCDSTIRKTSALTIQERPQPETFQLPQHKHPEPSWVREFLEPRIQEDKKEKILEHMQSLPHHEHPESNIHQENLGPQVQDSQIVPEVRNYLEQSRAQENPELDISPEYLPPQIDNLQEIQEVRVEILENGMKFYKFI